MPRPSHGAKAINNMDKMVVLGTILSATVADAVDRRLGRGWQAWNSLWPQVFQRGVRIEDRLALLEAVEAPAVLWGMESINVPEAQRHRFTVLQ